MQFEVDSLLYAVGFANSIFFALLLFNARKGNPYANRWLGAFFLVMVAIMLELVFEYTNFLFHYPHFSEVLSPFILLWGPFFYFYTKSLTSPDFRWNWKLAWHFVPLMICIALFTPFYLSSSAEKLQYLQTLYAELPVGNQYANWMGMPHLFAYIVAAFVTVRRHERHVKDIFSASLEKVNLSWLKRLSLGILITWVMWVNFHTFEFELLESLTSLGFMLLFFVLGYYAVQQNAIFPTKDWQNEPKKDEPKTPRVPADKRAILKTELLELMEREKLFCNNNLTLPELAERLAASTNAISELINTEFGENFYDFVNKYRLEESKRLLQNPDYEHYTILAIAYEAGFNSKTTFNTVFKNKMGITPSEFRKKQPIIGSAV